MKKWISELQDGERVCISALLREVGRGVTNKGAPYLSFVIQDKTCSMDAKFWNVDPSMLDEYQPGMLIDIKGDIINHKNQLQMRVLEVRHHEAADLDIRDYVKSSTHTKEELKKGINERLDAIQNEKIKAICQVILKQVENDFFEYPAASKNHHDFVGGLATHVLGMMELAESICDQYPLLNKDLLMAGVFLHDIGKLIELSGPIATEYTMEGKLLGHISIMQAMVSQVAQQLQIDGEIPILLRHMILSHHGIHEYGSPVLPMIPEAEVLYLIDNLDARMNTIEKAFSKVQEGEFTSRIYALEGRCFYKSKQ